MKKNTKKKMNNKGFSLVELIVVIAIMAILVGVLAPTIMGQIEKSKYGKDMQGLDGVYTAMQQVMVDEKASTLFKNALGKVTPADVTNGATLAEVITQIPAADKAKVTDILTSTSSLIKADGTLDNSKLSSSEFNTVTAIFVSVTNDTPKVVVKSTNSKYSDYDSTAK